LKKYLFSVLALLSLSCSDDGSRVIAKIPEASGISYCEMSDTLVVVNDEGWYYEIDTDGKLLTKKRAGKYDFEGVVCEKERFVFAVEDRGILLVERKTGKTKMVRIETVYRNKKLALFDKKNGIEGITKADDLFYLSRQAKKKNDSLVVAVKLNRFGSRIVDVIKPKIADISGLAYHNGFLYMVSDKKDLLIRYDLKKQKVIKKVKLSKSAQEGIAFDSRGFVYVADDDGRVLKYSEEMLGL
jgi:uncharacterized protein YjiK